MFKLRINRKYIYSYILTVFYIFLYHFFWEHFCCKYFSQLGYSYKDASLYDFIFSYIIAFIPIVFYNGLNRLSSFISIFLYLFAYIPIILSLKFVGYLPDNMVVNYQLILLIAMVSYFNIDKLHLNIKLNVAKRFKFDIIVYITILITLFLIFQYRGHMRLANFREIYALREENKEITTSGINGYLLFWLGKVFYPLLLLVYLTNKRIVKIIIVFFGFVLLFMMTGQKGIFLTPLLIVALYSFLNFVNKKGLDIFNLILTSLIVLSLILLSLIDNNPLVIAISALFFMRTLSMCGLLFPLYAKFFISNPYTYFSHISFVNKLTQMYPYKKDLGIVVAVNDSNANAMFWSTDGIASYGYTGVIIISIIVLLFLILINSLDKLHSNKNFIYLLFAPSIMALLNSSFFTYIISHGVFLIILILIFFKIPVQNDFQKQ